VTSREPRGAMDDVEFGAARDAYLDALWEDYIITGEGRRLAAYISSGGDMDARTRQEIGRCLRGLNITAHGNKDVAQDVEFYTRVNWEVSASRYAMALNPAVPGGRIATQQQAYKLLGPGFGASPRGAKQVYARGRNAFNEIFNSVDETVTDSSADAGSPAPSRCLPDLLTEYEVGRDPMVLAEYVEHGGEISDALKTMIIRELRGQEDDNRPHGQSYPYGDLEFYLIVEQRRKIVGTLVAALVSVGSEYRLERTGAKDKYKRGKRACRLHSMTDGSE
jgi:hypothetical protein